MDYDYNIRGWLAKVNDPGAPQASDLFSMALNYHTPTSNGGTEQFNGNISEIIWTTAGLDKQSYGYEYDQMNRILEANYFNINKPLQNGRYDEYIGDGTASRPAYDLNGNILNLLRTGKKIATPQGSIDDLRYFYRGNQLFVVNDGTPDNTGEEGFKELTEKTFQFGNTIGDEYLYDDNGNMTRDDNKGLTSIEYNFLNLPKRVNKSLTEYLTYTYDATGRKLRQQVYGMTAKVTDYSGEYVYENDTLRFVNHEEGRILPDATVGAPRPWEYQYFLKDHLGNVRVTFSEKTTTNEYAATMEAATNASFFNYNNRSNFNLFDHTDAGTTNTYSQLLNGGSAGRVGLAKSLAVNPGDVIDLEVYAKYEAPSTESNASDVLGALIAAFGLQSNGANYIDGQQAYNAFNDMFSAGPYIGRVPAYENGDAPRAYLNYILFDENFELADFGFDQVSTDADQGTPPPVVAHELLSLHVKVQQKGYLYIYLSNEQPVRTNVYFDDLKVVHHTGVEQVEDYYPFGLAFNSYQRENSVPQNYKFNGKEEQTELSLGWLDYQARQYDPTIGSWIVADPLAEHTMGWSPYHYSFNNPMRFVDPDGRAAIDKVLNENECLGCYQPRSENENQSLFPFQDEDDAEDDLFVFDHPISGFSTTPARGRQPRKTVRLFGSDAPAPNPLKKPVSALAWLIGNGMDQLLQMVSDVSEEDVIPGPNVVGMSIKAPKIIWNLTESVLLKSHHNWSKFFGNTVASLEEVQKVVRQVVETGTWETIKVIRKNGGDVLGEGVIMKGTVNEHKIWVEGTKLPDGTIYIKNAGVE